LPMCATASISMTSASSSTWRIRTPSPAIPTTLYVEFTGVNGASDIASIPNGQVVVSVVALPMARETGHLIFKITLSKKAPFDAYYLSGGRLVIDVT
jgi:hypothetical protein